MTGGEVSSEPVALCAISHRLTQPVGENTFLALVSASALWANHRLQAWTSFVISVSDCCRNFRESSNQNRNLKPNLDLKHDRRGKSARLIKQSEYIWRFLSRSEAKPRWRYISGHLWARLARYSTLLKALPTTKEVISKRLKAVFIYWCSFGLFDMNESLQSSLRSRRWNSHSCFPFWIHHLMLLSLPTERSRLKQWSI